MGEESKSSQYSFPFFSEHVLITVFVGKLGPHVFVKRDDKTMENTQHVSDTRPARFQNFNVG